MHNVLIFLVLAAGLIALIYVARCASSVAIEQAKQDVETDASKAEVIIKSDVSAVKADVAKVETDVKADVAKVETKL